MASFPLTAESEAYPLCTRLFPELSGKAMAEGRLSDSVIQNTELCRNRPYLPDLLRIEEARQRVEEPERTLCRVPQNRVINPALELLPVSWQGLPAFLADTSRPPQRKEGFVVIVAPPGIGKVEMRDATASELLALKIVAEDIDSTAAARLGGVSVGAIDALLRWAEEQGLLLAPASLLERPIDFPRGCVTESDPFVSPTFTLQWHLTQACDLYCRHCYDRSSRSEMNLAQGIRVLDELYTFCRSRHVLGQVSFSGGNPLLYPHFDRLYREAAERGFMTAILGNPGPVRRIEKILAVQRPEFFQVSLEGGRAYNDYIRGSGHYERTVSFLRDLGGLAVRRVVMLTLSRDNMAEVLPLAQALSGLAEAVSFNRLSPVGQGSRLAAVPVAAYPEFLEKYLAASADNPRLAEKDNLLNLARFEKGLPLKGGCTGHGCGAAFNFLSLLPDGEAHACRKFPSFIGSILENGLENLYESRQADLYRRGSAACAKCPIRPVCGACMAVSHGMGADIFRDPDPHCFRKRKEVDQNPTVTSL
jgi:selenobiotic family peptide radical SAM maturase